MLLCLSFGTGCRATSHVMRHAGPRTDYVTHAVRQLDGAFLDAGGRLHLRTTGRLAGETRVTELTVALPPAPVPHGPVERVVAPASAVQSGWNPRSPLRPVPVGPPLIFAGTDTYQWDTLRPASGRGQEVRLVQRAGAVVRWEVLRMMVDDTTDRCYFTVFEVRPDQVVRRRPAGLALMPLALASDIVAVSAMSAAPPVYVGACVLSSPYGGAAGLARLGDLEPVRQLREAGRPASPPTELRNTTAPATGRGR